MYSLLLIFVLVFYLSFLCCSNCLPDRFVCLFLCFSFLFCCCCCFVVVVVVVVVLGAVLLLF